MTKNGRRGLFLLVATVANMLLTVILIFALLAAWFGVASLLGIESGKTAAPAILVAFIAAVVLSGFVYSRVLKSLRKRPDLEERFGLLK
jgi:hypothetical protein